ncbi:MAG: glutathione S-transferase family protein [Steroidobacteraceae bacterium]
MSLTLFGHPFSSYCQKVIVALYENATPFDLRLVWNGDAAADAQFASLWPLKRMPVLVDAGRTVTESSIIIEYLGQQYPGPVALLPADARDALDVRRMDRIFDCYVMTPMQRIVFDHIRPADARDPAGVADAHALLETAYGWLDAALRGREWAAGSGFTLADCAAAPSLFYADWVHPIAPSHANLRAYRARLCARPSFARAVEAGRPYRKLFPPGAPDRD